ncbi:hypothetical protein KHC28_00115 [Ancylobacter sonchi]|uniref:hypothetical protein n=1 Tax=Ancylobacter sonchi TaxID=1937790 RepID=UPI001BD626ED|nr:hypothetical protein [Ancylobacter sonchi]MBS7532069.1 hypothetical protein [Ancylobacter sonchi]
MAKLSEAQFQVLDMVRGRDGYFSAWVLGTATCEALRKRGLVTNSFGDAPFRRGWDRNNGQVWITESGRQALATQEQDCPDERR